MAEKIFLGCKQVRLLLLHELKKQNSAGVAVGNIYGMIGPLSTTTTVSYDAVGVWFRQLKNGDFCFEDQPRSGRPVAVNEKRILELAQEDFRHCTRELAKKCECSYTTIPQHLRGLGKRRYGA
ncbi:unnamed protein product [Heligmosomoides polygyrus]|uniref:HTH_48 domain-containing protein n=1 Tax=Heligmosomoides polygyrus TaxID=6339 RepID=A0A183FH28_HELPZ|nr:unnamed protein product [Heligmosomoides polygyrus]